MKRVIEYKTCISCNRAYTDRPHSHYCTTCKTGQDKPKVKLCMVCGDLARNDRSMLCRLHFDEQLKMKVRDLA